MTYFFIGAPMVIMFLVIVVQAWVIKAGSQLIIAGAKLNDAQVALIDEYRRTVKVQQDYIHNYVDRQSGSNQSADVIH